jgi:hypothetical protein
MEKQKLDIAFQLERLVELQQLDAELFAFKKELASIPEQIQQIKQNYEGKKSSLREAEEELKKTQVARKEKEIELASREEGIKKMQVQLYQIKTNKEYSALQDEISAKKADNSLLEEEILKIMDSIDAIEGTISAMKPRLAEEDRKMEEEIAKKNAYAQELQAKIDSLVKARQEKITSVDGELLKKYERILDKKAGFAIVAIENNACGGCHIALPPQVINEVRLKKDIIMCETCARILYYKE